MLVNAIFHLLRITPREQTLRELNIYHLLYRKHKGSWVETVLAFCKLHYAQSFINNACYRLIMNYENLGVIATGGMRAEMTGAALTASTLIPTARAGMTYQRNSCPEDGNDERTGRQLNKYFGVETTLCGAIV